MLTRIMSTALAAALLPVAAFAQQDPVARLGDVLPEAVRAQVMARVEAARARGLPEQAVANLALEGVAKGRGSDEVLAAVEALIADMGRAQDALRSAGHEPANGEVEAATAAMRMGADGASVSELARSTPSGRSLAVPLLVLGGLTERGLPSDEALAAVRDRLEARANDADLVRAFPPQAGRPDVVGPALAGTRAGFPLPVGPPDDRGRPNGRGRSGGPSN